MSQTISQILKERVKETKKELEENPIEAVKSAFDIIFEINLRNELQGFKIALKLGGPNIYLENDKIVGYWGKEEYMLCIPSKTYDQIWNYIEELNPCH